MKWIDCPMYVNMHDFRTDECDYHHNGKCLFETNDKGEYKDCKYKPTDEIPTILEVL